MNIDRLSENKYRLFFNYGKNEKGEQVGVCLLYEEKIKVHKEVKIENRNTAKFKSHLYS